MKLTVILRKKKKQQHTQAIWTWSLQFTCQLIRPRHLITLEGKKAKSNTLKIAQN